MLTKLEAFKAFSAGFGIGLAVLVFMVGLYTCVGFVLAQMGRAMGCAA